MIDNEIDLKVINPEEKPSHHCCLIRELKTWALENCEVKTVTEKNVKLEKLEIAANYRDLLLNVEDGVSLMI